MATTNIAPSNTTPIVDKERQTNPVSPTIILFAVIITAGPTFLSYINYVIPVEAYFTGELILSEAIEWHSLAALLLIILGIALTRKRFAD